MICVFLQWRCQVSFVSKASATWACREPSELKAEHSKEKWTLWESESVQSRVSKGRKPAWAVFNANSFLYPRRDQERSSVCLRANPCGQSHHFDFLPKYMRFHWVHNSEKAIYRNYHDNSYRSGYGHLAGKGNDFARNLSESSSDPSPAHVRGK